MPDNDNDTVTITLHGVTADKGFVRADVFVEKLSALIASAKIADQHLNKKKSHHILVTDLRVSSAIAILREKVSVKKKVPEPSFPLVARALMAIYDGEKRLDNYSVDLIRSLEKLAKTSKRYSHGEVSFSNRTVIRIDEYLHVQAKKALERVTGEEEVPLSYFEGKSIGSFDGVLQELDSRGAFVRGRLTLTAGGKEVECIFRREDIPTLRESYERRARIVGVAIYDGVNPLPVRLEVRSIEPLNLDADLSKWRGVFAGRRVSRSEGL